MPIFGPEAAETTKGAKNTKNRVILPQSAQRKQRKVAELPGSVVGHGDDPAGSKMPPQSVKNPKNRPKTATNGPKMPIFGPEEAETTKGAKNAKIRTILPQSAQRSRGRR